jgi:hypothetical protein
MRPLPKRDDGLLPTLLKVTNAAAKEINTAQLKELNQPLCRFLCLDGSQRSGDDPCTAHTNKRHEASCDLFRESCNAEPEVQFAIGAQVELSLLVVPENLLCRNAPRRRSCSFTT